MEPTSIEEQIGPYDPREDAATAATVMQSPADEHRPEPRQLPVQTTATPIIYIVLDQGTGKLWGGNQAGFISDLAQAKKFTETNNANKTKGALSRKDGQYRSEISAKGLTVLTLDTARQMLAEPGRFTTTPTMTAATKPKPGTLLATKKRLDMAMDHLTALTAKAAEAREQVKAARDAYVMAMDAEIKGA